MLPWKKIILASAGLLLDVGTFLLLVVLSMSYGDETNLLENEAYQQSERRITIGWWLWWVVNAGIIALLFYRAFRQRATARHQRLEGLD